MGVLSPPIFCSSPALPSAHISRAAPHPRAPSLPWGGLWPFCLLPCLPIYLMLLLFPFFPPYDTGQLCLVVFSLCPPLLTAALTLCR